MVRNFLNLGVIYFPKALLTGPLAIEHKFDSSLVFDEASFVQGRHPRSFPSI